MNKKTGLFKVISLMLAAASAVLCGFTACGSSATAVDEKTITVKCMRAGFGTDWLYDLTGKFETAFAAEGYKVNILTPDRSISGETVIKELARGYDAIKVDVYITASAFPDKVGALGNYGVLVEDIRDSIYNKPAISYDGTEEDILISEKLSEDVVPFVIDSNGIMYGFNWAQSSGGLVVNTRKLAKYNLQIPRTTNEMFDCFQKIYCGYNGIDNSINSSTYPLTYVPGNNGYGVCFLNALMAQYDGDFYDSFWSFTSVDGDGNVIELSEDGYRLFNDAAVYEMLNVAYRTFDVKISAPGSTNQSLDQAQAKVMGDKNGAVFMFNGDWMLNEVKLNYKNKLHDIDFVNFPVISALGVKLFGAGTSYNMSEAACDELLSYIIGLADENTDIADIVVAVRQNKGIDIAEADAAEVARARGVSFSRGVEHIAYITKDTPKKDIASLFYRMMASDDFGRTFSELANGATPYYAEENTTSEYSFVRNASKITSNRYFSLISSGARGYRKLLNLNQMFTTQTHIPDYISSRNSASIFDTRGGMSGESVAIYATLARGLQTEEFNNVKNNWSNYKKNAGLN